MCKGYITAYLPELHSKLRGSHKYSFGVICGNFICCYSKYRLFRRSTDRSYKLHLAAREFIEAVKKANSILEIFRFLAKKRRSWQIIKSVIKGILQQNVIAGIDFAYIIQLTHKYFRKAFCIGGYCRSQRRRRYTAALKLADNPQHYLRKALVFKLFLVIHETALSRKSFQDTTHKHSLYYVVGIRLCFTVAL